MSRAMHKTKRRKKAVGPAPTFTVADYYRMKLLGQLPPTTPTYEEYQNVLCNV